MRHALGALAASALALGAPAAEDDGNFAASKGSAAEAELHARLKAAVRTIPGTDTQYLIGGYLQLDGPFGTRDWHVNGTGVSLSGSLDVRGDDTLLWQAVTGKGVGRYFNDPLSATGVALGTDGRFDLLRSSGVTLYYRHRWAPDWMTAAGASTLWTSEDGQLRRPEELRRVVYASANLLYRITPTLIVGGELLWGEATRVDGTSATNARVQLSVRYLIF